MLNFSGLQGEVAFHHSLARYTSWRIGGPADIFFRPKNRDDLICFLQQLPDDVPLTWLGLGSNTLVRDGGIRGAVILTLNRLNEIHAADDHTIFAECGVTCAKLSKLCAAQGYEAGAFFCGIPGTIGGALFMNAGAFGGETWPHVLRVTTVDRQGHIFVRDAKTFHYAYRHLDGLGGQYFLDATLQFSPGDPVVAEQHIKQWLQKRNESQPIGVFSCGSTFTNPPNDYAGRLIEACGLKGHRIGGAVVSDKHANFLINDANASSRDIEALTRMIQTNVAEKFGVHLVPEYRVLGEDE